MTMTHTELVCGTGDTMTKLADWCRANPHLAAMEIERLTAPAQRTLGDMPKSLGDVIPVSEMVDRLERRGAELNADTTTPNGQLMLKAAFYLKALSTVPSTESKTP